MPLLPRRRREREPDTKYRKPVLPDGLFVLVSPPDLPIEEADWTVDRVDGPLDPGASFSEPDGSVVFLTEGFPYVLKVERQEGDVLWVDVEEDGPVPYKIHEERA